MSYIVLMSILLRDLFPDPDILLKHGDWNQHQGAAWFVKWITDTIQGVEPGQELFSGARTRRDLCGSLRVQCNAQLTQDIPSRIQLLIRVLPDWPTITNGGCRFLIQARVWSLQTLIRATYTWEEDGITKTSQWRMSSTPGSTLLLQNFSM